MAGLPVTITSGGLPVTVTGAGAQSIPITAIGIPAGATADQAIVVDPTGVFLTVAPGFFSEVLFQTSLPFIFLSSGSIGNNGALSGITALPVIYANTYVYVPAGGIAAGVPAAAAWYFAQFSSTTAATIFNNVYTTGQPTIPASPTAFVTTGPGAFTGVSGSAQAQVYAMPASTMKLRDSLRVSLNWSVTNSAGVKTVAFRFGSSDIFSLGLTTVLTAQDIFKIANRDSTSSQVSAVATQSPGNVNSAFLYSTEDTTAQLNLSTRGNNATPATNNIILESTTIELLKGS